MICKEVWTQKRPCSFFLLQLQGFEKLQFSGNRELFVEKRAATFQKLHCSFVLLHGMVARHPAPSQVMPTLKVKGRSINSSLEGHTRKRHAWAQKFHGLLHKHRIKTALAAVKKAKSADAATRVSSRDYMVAVDHGLQAPRP